MPDTDVVVIGGGLAGLTCAVGLSSHGMRVCLLEASNNLGGRAQSITDPTTAERVDLGPHILVTQYRNMRRLLKQLGTDQQVVWQDKPRLILVEKPKPVVMHLRPLPAPLHFASSFINVPQVPWWDQLSNRRIFWQILRSNQRSLLALDNINAERHLRRMGVRPRAIDWFWRTAAMTIMNTPLELCSAGALFRFIRYLIGRNDFLFGFAGVGLGDLFTEQACRLITGAGGQVLMETAATELMLNQNTTTGVRLANGHQITARTCIAALPPMALETLAPPGWENQPPFAHCRAFKSSPYICTYLWFADKLTREPFWTKVWSPHNVNYDFYDLSNIKPRLAGGPSLIASNCMYSVRSAALTDDEVIHQTRAEIAEYLPAAAHSQITHARVHRVPMGIVMPTPGTEQLRPTTRTPLPQLYLAGDWIDTGLPCSMESAVRSGWLAAEAVLAAGGRPCVLAEALPPLTGFARLLGGSLAGGYSQQVISGPNEQQGH